MPFDTIAAKKTINSLMAHRQQPGGELMEQAAKSLQEALNDASHGIAQIRAAESEAQKANGLYQDSLLEIKRLREADAMKQRAIAALQDCASSKKGASQKAKDWLISVGLMQPDAPAPVAEAKK